MTTTTLREAAEAALDTLDRYEAESAVADALRAALAQPVPAPAEPVAEVLIDSCADHESRIEAMAYLPAGTMLYRAPQPAPALVPPGWVLVPVNATPEMKAACVKAAKGWWDSRAWPAMLAAAPSAQQLHYAQRVGPTGRSRAGSSRPPSTLAPSAD